MYDLNRYQFHLPEELIAQAPCTPRDHSKLLVVNRQTGDFQDLKFYELQDLLNKDDLLIFNNTRVIPARLKGKRSSGGQAEVFLIEKLGELKWKALVKPGRKLKKGQKVDFLDGISCTIIEEFEEGVRTVIFECIENFNEFLSNQGEIPLPHYIGQNGCDVDHKESYQTVYAKEDGAVAAPTAGLHFTSELLGNMKNKGISLEYLTLHVGPGTFKPVVAEDIRNHHMHEERLVIADDTAKRINNKTLGARAVCVGTTCCRALESSASESGKIVAGERSTDIFIYPGYQFKFVDCLLTNFHLPGSSLIMLVSAFAGYELIMEAYQKAIKDRYRFYSYGDAMLIL